MSEIQGIFRRHVEKSHIADSQNFSNEVDEQQL